MEEESKLAVKIAGKEYELVPANEMTFSEQRELKRLSNGMSIMEWEERAKVMDPDAWFAWLFISIKRVDARVTESYLETLNLVSILESMANDDEEEESNPPEGADVGSDVEAS